MSGQTCIEIQNINKYYRNTQILKDVSVSFEKGEIHGIIGRNGSGKTQLFKCICGFVKPETGNVIVDGKQIGKDIDVPDHLGMIIENPGFLPGYSGYENLRMLYTIRNKLQKKKIKEAMQMVGLDPDNRKPVGKYSMGMRQRLGIAQAFMEGQQILILDEPMNGLDNQGVEDMRRLFLCLKKEGRTILLASHNREDIEQLCDTVHEMDAGRLCQRKRS